MSERREADVVPLRTARPRTTAGDAVRTGADRAGGERARRRRRVTPLLEEADARRRREPQPARPPESRGDQRNHDPRTPGHPRPSTAAAGRRRPTGEARQEWLQEAAEAAGDAGARLVDGVADTPDQTELEHVVAGVVDFLRRRLTGQYEVDEFGFDAELTETVLMSLLRPIYRRWFRVQVRGLGNVPDTGGALVVANHSGTIAMDALMAQVALFDEHPAQRHLRLLGADLVFETPVMSDLARKIGSTLATNADAERLLTEGHLVGVFPEGFKGIGKPFTERYKLQRFGRGGFVSAALRTATPIVPCSIVGAEEIYPIIGRSNTLARLLNVPYVPITPTFPLLGPLGLIPLPSKWLIEFGEPIPTDELGPTAAEDPMLVFDLTDQVRETIQQTLYALLMQRRSVFF